MADPLVNQTIGGCAILEVIGQGGMGVIYKGRQKSLDRVVAVKVLAPHLANDANFVTRFQKEARAIARVNHPHILAVYDVGTDQNINFMIMELIEGESLAELQAKRHGALEWQEATEFVRQAAQGLEASQATGIVHRDIKPENLMVTRKGQIKVSDFGLAKDADGAGTQTCVDSVMGTPAFMSPEQCDGKKVDARSDIYSLGGTWYRLITGRLPFEAETAISTMYRHKNEALVAPDKVLPTIPRAISDVICKMMAKKREHRYQTFSEVIEAIEAAVREALGIDLGEPGPRFEDPTQLGASQFGSDDGGPERPGFLSQFGVGDAGLGRPPAPPSIDMSGAHRRGQMNSQFAPIPSVPGMSNRFNAEPSDQSQFNSAMGGGIPGARQSAMPGMNLRGATDEGSISVARGDEMLARGDRVNALKAFIQALQSNTLDIVTRERVEQEINREVATRRQNADNLLKRGALIDAQRECRILAELDPYDETLTSLLKDIESRLALKRARVNEIRNAIASSQFENAIKIWDGTPTELRDDILGKQIEQLRVVVVPSAKLALQGESFSKQGRLEEAIATYEDALKINPSSEQARLGLKESEGKLQRIDYLLKEGYQYNLEQNYAKAIETWTPILHLRPGHPQAIKSIVEAYTQHGQTLLAQGDLAGAMNLYQSARNTDPTNRAVAKMTDEITAHHDKEKKLLDQVQEATKNGRLGEAIRCWKGIVAVNPANRKAQQQVQLLAKKRKGSLVVKLVAAVLLVAGGITGYQYLSEQLLINRVRKSFDERDFAEALNTLQKHTYLFNEKKVKQLKIDVGDEREIQQAEKRAFSDLKGGAEDYKGLAMRLADVKPERSKQLYELALDTLAKLYLGLARDAIKAKHWQEAGTQYMKLERDMHAIKERNDNLRKAEEEMNNGKSLIASIVEAEKQALTGNAEVAFDKYKQAENRAVELNLDDTVKFIKQALIDIHYNPDVYKSSMENGVEILSQLTPDLAAASQAFRLAIQNHPNDSRAKMYLSYINDLKYCDAKGQSMYSEHRPSPSTPNFTWSVDERRKAFCIDRYEFPNTAGEKPEVNVPFVLASQKCSAEGKKLCTSTRWKDACQGSTNALYPYGTGKQADPAACNTEGDKLLPSGAKPTCRNSIGVFDMSGNAAEWTEDLGDGVNAVVMGGSYKEKAADAGCMATYSEKQEDKFPNVGFRCCRDLEAKDK